MRYWERIGTPSRMHLYKGFEQLVAQALTVLIAVIILVSLYRLAEGVVMGLLRGILNPLDPKAFQNIFGEILTVLIAMEFRYSILSAAPGCQGIIQIKTVILIALLAIARKFIILDIYETSPASLAAMAAASLALGGAYWMIRERDDRLAGSGQDRTES